MFAGDRSGSYAIIGALCLPLIIGAGAMGTEAGLLLYTQRAMQHAADSGAVSAAVAYGLGSNDVTVQGKSVTSSYGFSDGTGGVVVTVNQPPQSGPHTATSGAVEVIIQKNQPRLFSLLWASGNVPVLARSVAVSTMTGCVLALDPTANQSASAQGSVNIGLVNCNIFDDSTSSSALSLGGSSTLSASFVGVVGGISGMSSITAPLGIKTGYHAVTDPYAAKSFGSFSGCDHNNYSSKTTETINPGVYCGGMSLGAGANVTLNPGIYYLDGGSLGMQGSSALSGTGVTLVFTSSSGNNYANASIGGGASVNLTAPTTGPTAGIAIFGDRSMPLGTTFKLNGGGAQNVTGAVYLPRAAVEWAGSPTTTVSSCTQVVADTISFVGSSGFAVNCTGRGTNGFGSAATVVE